jgi:hypothetical protein
MRYPERDATRPPLLCARAHRKPGVAVFLFLFGFGVLALLMKGKATDLSLGNTAASAIGLSPAEYLEGAMVAGTVGRGGGGGGHGGGGSGRGGFGGGGPGLWAGLGSMGFYDDDSFDMDVDPVLYVQPIRPPFGTVAGVVDPVVTYTGEHEVTTGAPILYDEEGQRCMVAGDGSLVYV